jgi:hypothetical protein
MGRLIADSLLRTTDEASCPGLLGEVDEMPVPTLPLVDRIAELPGDWHQAGSLTDGVVRRMDMLIREGFPSGLNASAETGCGKSTLLLSCYSKRHLCFTLGADNNDSLTKVQESEHPSCHRPGLKEGPPQTIAPKSGQGFQVILFPSQAGPARKGSKPNSTASRIAHPRGVSITGGRRRV